VIPEDVTVAVPWFGEPASMASTVSLAGAVTPDASVAVGIETGVSRSVVTDTPVPPLTGSA
jgi:hypothetical protein